MNIHERNGLMVSASQNAAKFTEIMILRFLVRTSLS